MKKYLVFAATILALAGCQNEPDPKRLYDELVVSTNYDADATFSSYNTFAMPTDTIGLISETSDDTILTASESTFPRPVLESLRANLLAMGYTRVDRTEDPDIGINVVVVNDFNVFQEIVYPDPYYYPGGYYSGYYGYGGYYSYPYISTYAYNTGVLMIEMVDLRNRTPDNKVKVVWTAYLGDLYSTIDLIEQTRSAIDQAFLQSPYLSKSGS